MCSHLITLTRWSTPSNQFRTIAATLNRNFAHNIAKPCCLFYITSCYLWKGEHSLTYDWIIVNILLHVTRNVCVIAGPRTFWITISLCISGIESTMLFCSEIHSSDINWFYGPWLHSDCVCVLYFCQNDWDIYEFINETWVYSQKNSP